MDTAQNVQNNVTDTRFIMGMPITISVVGSTREEDIEDVFSYFVSVDNRFSTYKEHSEIMRINRGELAATDFSADMQEVFALALTTKRESGGYFDIVSPDGSIDPSGIVKGWSIRNAADILRNRGYKHFYIDAGGDIQSEGMSESGETWRVGIRNPFNHDEIVKVVCPRGAGMATSGTAARGAHIYNPLKPGEALADIVSITVIGPNAMEADRFATAAFAMGEDGIHFIEMLPGFEAYQIDSRGIATMTSGFNDYVRD
jgi:thiamine biosynthesis lipoprotein